MLPIISIEFIYKSTTYYALIREKLNVPEKQYHITVMNGDLEKLLYGHHIILDKDGLLTSSTVIVDPAVAELKKCIINALSHYFTENKMEAIVD
jgi:hypothetical protein